MVCHPSCAPALSSLSIILCFLSLWCHPLLLRAAMFCFILLPSGGQMRKKRAREKASGLVSSHHHHSLHSSPPDLCPPSFRLPEWQLAAGRVQWAGQHPSLYTFANGLEKTHPRACGYIRTAVASRRSHYCPRSMAAIKTCNSTSTANESSGTHSGTRPHHKIKHLSRGPFSRSLKNNYMWTDSKFWWTFPIRKIKRAKNGVASVLAPALLLRSQSVS